MTIWHWRILKWNWFIFEWHWFLFNWQWFVFYRRWFIYNWHLLKFENIYIQIILKYYLNLKTLTFIVNFIDINFELELMIFMINFKLMTFITDFELRKSIINFNDMYIKIITFIFKLTDIHLRLWLQLNLKLMTFVWIHSHLSLMILFSYEKQKCLLPRRCLGWQDFSRRRSRLGPSLRYDIAARSSTDEHRRARLSQFRFLDQRIVQPLPARTKGKTKMLTSTNSADNMIQVRYEIFLRFSPLKWIAENSLVPRNKCPSFLSSMPPCPSQPAQLFSSRRPLSYLRLGRLFFGALIDLFATGKTSGLSACRLNGTTWRLKRWNMMLLMFNFYKMLCILNYRII